MSAPLTDDDLQRIYLRAGLLDGDERVMSVVAELRRLRAEVDAVKADFRRVEGEADWVTLHLSRIATAVGVTTHENAASSPEEVLRAVQVAVEDRRRIGLDLITVRAERDALRDDARARPALTEDDRNTLALLHIDLDDQLACMDEERPQAARIQAAMALIDRLLAPAPSHQTLPTALNCPEVRSGLSRTSGELREPGSITSDTVRAFTDALIAQRKGELTDEHYDTFLASLNTALELAHANGKEEAAPRAVTAIRTWVDDSDPAAAMREVMGDPSPASPDPEAVERRLTVGEALRDPEVRAGRAWAQIARHEHDDKMTHHRRWTIREGRLLMQWSTTYYGQPPSWTFTNAEGDYPTSRPRLADLDAECALIPAEAP